MTQNNERETLHKIMEQVQVYASSYSIVGTRFASDNQLEEADSEKLSLYNMVKSALSQSPISQNEHQEVVAEIVCDPMFLPALKVPLVSWKADIVKFSIGTKLYTSPPKQIPDGWEPSEKEILKYASEEELFLFADESDLLEIANGILELVQIKINTSPTTSETNTEVGE